MRSPFCHAAVLLALVYRKGELDAAEGNNPFPYDEGLSDGGPDGSEFTVGSVSVSGKPGNFFGGWLGGVAVLKRALSAEEVRRIARESNVSTAVREAK